MNERELFEEAFKLENPVLFAMLIKGDITAHNCYEMSWRMWQAAIQREGFKFVPVEPTIEMLEDAADEHVLHGASYAGIYKAMIGAADD